MNMNELELRELLYVVCSAASAAKHSRSMIGWRIEKDYAIVVVTTFCLRRCVLIVGLGAIRFLSHLFAQVSNVVSDFERAHEPYLVKEWPGQISLVQSL